MVVAKDAMGAIEGAKEMSDAIRQAAEGCTSGIIVSSGIVSLPDRMADIIERAMRKLVNVNKPTYCLGRETISKLAAAGELRTSIVDFVAADSLFHADPYAQPTPIAGEEELIKQLKKIMWYKDAAKQIRARGELEAERSSETVGYLIEQKEFGCWAEVRTQPFVRIGWTRNSELGLRFSRREDAEAVRLLMQNPDSLVVTEHVWVCERDLEKR